MGSQKQAAKEPPHKNRLTVNSSRYPLRINIGFLINQNVGSYRDLQFEVPHLNLDGDFAVSDFAAGIRVGRVQQGVLAQAALTGRVDLECVRCLEGYQHIVETEFQELFAFKNKGVTESGLVIPEDGNINLAPLVREYLLLEVPISPLCSPNCKGLCTVCGTNLNQETCEHNASIEVG